MRGQNSGKQGGEAAGELMRGVWRVPPPHCHGERRPLRPALFSAPSQARQLRLPPVLLPV